jgi:hypothetical protein
MGDDAARRRLTERLTLAIQPAADVDAQELAHLTHQLRRTLLELDVEDVRPIREDDIPPGAKAVDAAAAGALVVTLAPVAMQGVIGVVQAWLAGRPAAAIKVTIGRDSLELTNATAEQVEQLTSAFLSRHPPT